MSRHRRIKALGFVLTILFVAAYLKGQLSKGSLHSSERAAVSVKTDGESNQLPRQIAGVISDIKREDRVPGQFQKFARCFFPQEVPVKKTVLPFIADPARRRFVKRYSRQDALESETFFDKEIEQTKERSWPAGSALKTTGGVEAVSPGVPSVTGADESDHVLTSQQEVCLGSFAGDRNLDKAKSIYRKIISLQERRERLIKGLVQFNETEGDAFQLRLNELNQAIDAYKARFFFGFTMKRRRINSARKL